jgi:hypothetical protein
MHAIVLVVLQVHHDGIQGIVDATSKSALLTSSGIK